MPDIIVDRKLTQDEAGQLMAPLELDLLSLFKVMQQDIITGMEGFEGTPEQYIESVLKNLSGSGGEMVQKSNIKKTAVLKAIQENVEKLIKRIT